MGWTQAGDCINRQERTIVRAYCRGCARAGERQVGCAGGELALTFIDADARVDECVVNRRVDHATVIDYPDAPNTRLAITGQVVSKADARNKVVIVANLDAVLRQ